jgi:murein L,D-transpeptidase YcbB/YkuD
VFKKILYTTGDMHEADTTLLFDSALAAGVKRAQYRFGFKEDGIVNAALIAALNVTAADRIQQLLVNMERMRWLPKEPAGTRLVANIPEFKLHIFEDKKEVKHMNIVVGKAGSSSVIFTDELKYIVFSPYWNVPTSITRSEIVPGMKRNPNYISSKNMEITGYSNGLPIVRQKPGGSNALGDVKFIFPNSYNIYFHDTPSKSLFEKEKRAFSHGCIRLGEPFELAKYLLRSDTAWNDEKIKAAMVKGEEKWVTLTQSIPVFITYFTAWADQEGRIHFREDIYGHDAKMKERLFR